MLPPEALSGHDAKWRDPRLWLRVELLDPNLHQRHSVCCIHRLSLRPDNEASHLSLVPLTANHKRALGTSSSMNVPIRTRQRRRSMVMELTIIPLGRGPSISGDIADLVRVIEDSSLDYRMTAFGTLIEGSWDQLTALARECHFEVRKKTDRVLTLIRIDDYGERTGEIEGGVNRIEQKLGRAVKK